MLYFVTLLVLIFAGIIKGKSQIIFWCIYVIIFIIANHTTEGNDITNYEIGYNNPISEEASNERSIIWSVASMFFRNVGVSFYQFRLICFFIWSIGIIFFIRKRTINPAYVLAVCAIFPLLAFGSQIRNAVAVALVFISYWSLIKGKIIWSIIFLLIAGFIHYIAFIYFLGLGARLKIRSSTLLNWCIIFALLVSVLINSAIFYNLLSKSISYYADFYFSGVKEYVAPINYIVYISAIFINLYFSIIAQPKKHISKSQGVSDTKMSSFIMRLNIIFIITIPFLFVSLSFFRIYQNIIILTAITVANSTSANARNIRYAYAIFLMILAAYVNYGTGEFLISMNSIRFIDVL